MNRFYCTLLSLLLFSCSSKDPAVYDDFPKIVIETESDTVKIGEIYRAKVSFSDTSLLYIQEPNKTKRTKIFPLFIINGEEKDVNQNHYIYETVVDSVDIQNLGENTKYKEWSIELVFPHPSDIGDVVLSQRRSYVVEPK